MSFLCWLGRETCASLGPGRVHCRHQAKLIGPDLAKRLAHVSVTPSQLAQKHLNSVKLFCCNPKHASTFTPSSSIRLSIARHVSGTPNRKARPWEGACCAPPQKSPKTGSQVEEPGTEGRSLSGTGGLRERRHHAAALLPFETIGHS